MGGSDNKNCIELVSCPGGGENCSNHLSVINDKLEVARDLFASKDYSKGVNYLAEAYSVTFNLSHGFCVKCAGLFRETILKSLNNQVEEIEKLTVGLFKRPKHLPDLQYATEISRKLKAGEIYFLTKYGSKSEIVLNPIRLDFKR